jgi:replicative DNA helicase
MKNIEHKLLATVIHNPELFEDLCQYDVFTEQESKDLFNILSVVQKKHSMINNELIVNFIQKQKNFRIGAYYDIKGEYEEKDYYKGYLNELLIEKNKKELMIKAHEISNQNYKDLIDIKNDINAIADSIKTTESKEIEDCKKDIIEEMERMQKGEPWKMIYSGVDWIEKTSGGIEQDTFLIISGRQSSGKTTFVRNVMIKQLQKGMNLYLQSCEERKKKLVMKFACSIAGVSMTKHKMNMTTNEEKAKIIQAYERLYELPLFIDDSTNNWNDMKRKIKEIVKEKKVDMVYIDHMHDIEVPGIFDEISKTIKICDDTRRLIIDLGIPICHIATQTKGAQQKDKPAAEDVKGSSKVQFIGDIFILLKTRENRGAERLVDFYVDKNRDGQIGMFQQRFFPQVGQFKNLI